MNPSTAGNEGFCRSSVFLPLTLTFILCGLGGCGDNATGPDNFVSVDQVFWQAYSSPDTFDQWLNTQSVEPGAAGCFRSQSNTLLGAENQTLTECRQLITGSAAWNECHDDADNLHNAAVIMNDLARTVDGMTRFADTDSGQLLIFTKSLVGDADWNAVTGALRILLDEFPPLQCG